MPRTLLAGEAINAAIASIAQRSAALDTDIHSTAVQCLMHAETHSDPRKMDNLIKALGKAHRAKALKTWVETYSPIRWNGDGQVGLMKQTDKRYVAFNIDGADEMPFWDLTEETVKKPLTLAALQKIVAAMVDRVEKAQKGDKGASIADGEDPEVLMAYAVSLTKVKAPKAKPAANADVKATGPKPAVKVGPGIRKAA